MRHKALADDLWMANGRMAIKPCAGQVMSLIHEKGIMRPQTYTILFVIMTVVFGLSPLKAQITISDFLLTSNSVSFSINGTFPSSLPPSSNSALLFVNPIVSASPGFALGSGMLSSTFSFAGSHPLESSYTIATGIENAGDYLSMVFPGLGRFAANEAIFGTLSATWSSSAFDPSAVSSLNVFWGNDVSLPLDPSTQPSNVTGGIFLTSVVVPEPSTYALLLMTGAGALWWARRRRAKRSWLSRQG